MPSSVPPTTYIDTAVFLWYFNKPEAVGGVTLHEAQQRQIIARTLFEEAQQKQRKIQTSIYTKIEVAYTNEEVRIKKLDPSALAKIDTLLNDPNIVSLLSVSNQIATRARDVVRMTKFPNMATIKPKDAIHIASALVYEADEFFTYDEGLCKWDKQLYGLPICHPYPFTMPML